MSVPVRAGRPGSSFHFRRVSRRERLRSTFWYIPTLFIVASVGLAIVMHQRGASNAGACCWASTSPVSSTWRGRTTR